jgi:hypothetical protein
MAAHLRNTTVWKFAEDERQVSERTVQWRGVRQALPRRLADDQLTALVRIIFILRRAIEYVTPLGLTKNVNVKRVVGCDAVLLALQVVSRIFNAVTHIVHRIISFINGRFLTAMFGSVDSFIHFFTGTFDGPFLFTCGHTERQQ